VICNPTAGAGRSKNALNHFRANLESEECNFTIYQTQKNRDHDGIRAIILTYQPDLIAVVGGDGTLNNVINAMPDLMVPIHVIPAGSGNDFHSLTSNRKLGSDTNFSADLVSSDIWICNEYRFHNGVGLGFDGSIAHQTQYSKWTWLPLSLKYWIAIFRNIFTYRSQHCNVRCNEYEFKGPAFMISVANGTQYGGGFKVAPDAKIDDGLLDIVLIKKIHPIKRLFYVPKVEKGKHMHLDVVEHVRTSDLIVEYDTVILVHMDGEVFEAKKFVFKKLGEIQVLP